MTPETPEKPTAEDAQAPSRVPRDESSESDAPAREIGGRKGPDPTRYGDWEKGGRCIDF